MGTVVTYARSKSFFDRTLALMRPLLKQHGYCGYINLNTIVNERGIWPLEFTCRFGYPGYAILDPLQRTSWSDLLRSMLDRNLNPLRNGAWLWCRHRHYHAAVPLFPGDVAEPVGLPILFADDLTRRRSGGICTTVRLA